MLSSAFSSGEPTANAAVRLVPPGGGSPIEVGRTNASGQLSFALPKGANGDWEVQVDGGPGHRDYLDMPVRQGRAQLDKLSHAIDTPWRLDRATALAAGGAALAGVVAQGWGRRKTLDRG
jgi:nickel transport protein